MVKSQYGNVTAGFIDRKDASNVFVSDKWCVKKPDPEFVIINISENKVRKKIENSKKQEIAKNSKKWDEIRAESKIEKKIQKRFKVLENRKCNVKQKWKIRKNLY